MNEFDTLIQNHPMALRSDQKALERLAYLEVDLVSRPDLNRCSGSVNKGRLTEGQPRRIVSKLLYLYIGMLLGLF
jgi:hypothetical protein